jgi:tetratricopeptide (TPR) repeat protein
LTPTRAWVYKDRARLGRFLQGNITVAEIAQGQFEASDADKKKAKAFFDRGNTVAGTGNYEYAIEMYISGLAFDPDSTEAHETLRDISLKRKATGGKSLGMFEAMKLKRPSKDDKQNLLNNEKLLAYDPGNTDYMVGVLQNAVRGTFYNTAMWVGPVLQKANADSPKPEVSKFIVLRDSYISLQQWKLATDACHYAAMLRPDDMDLQKSLRDLGAKDAEVKGKYGVAKNFTESVKDAAGQQKLMNQDKEVHSLDNMRVLIEAAEKEWKADPNDAGKVAKFADVLVKTEDTEYENKAIDLLQDAFDRSKQFRFRQRIGMIRMAQMSRMERSLRAAVNANPTDAEARQTYAQFAQEKLLEELSEFQLASENYPTDTKLKFEVADRLYRLRRYDEAIPLFQQLRQDPKYKIDGTIALGKAFLEAGYVDEAVDTLAAVLTDYPHKGDNKSIDMTYVYGRALEQKKELPSAIKAYSQVAQWSFNFKDVQVRIKKLRAEAANPPVS